MRSFPLFFFLSFSSLFFFCLFFWRGPLPSSPPPFDEHPVIQCPGLLQFIQWGSPVLCTCECSCGFPLVCAARYATMTCSWFVLMARLSLIQHSTSAEV